MLVTDWGLVSACEGPPLRVLRRVLSTNPAEKGPDLGMMGARSVNRRHFRLSMLSFEAEAAVQAEPVPPVLPVLYLDDVMCAVMKPEKLLVHRTEIANGVFVAYAPYEDPEIAVAIVIEKGGAGAALASTAVEIINAYFADRVNGGDVVGENTMLK